MAKKILLADDSITIQKVVELTFSDGDYEVIAVNNGAKAIAKLNDVRPDIILSDIIMPEKNGYEVCEFVKSHPEYRNIPVVLLTGTFEPFDPDRADKAGCDAVVTKPFESQSLIHKVEELIDQSQTNAPTQPSPAMTEAAAPASPAAPTSASSWMDQGGEPAESFTSASTPPSSQSDLFGASSAGSSAADPFGASPSAESFSGETRAFPKMSFEDMPQPSVSSTTSLAPAQTDARASSPWDEQPSSGFSGETRAFPRMNFEEMQKPSQPSTPAPSSMDNDSPFGASPSAESFSGETRAFPKLSTDDAHKGEAAAPASPKQESAPSPWDEQPAFSGETKAFPKMSFEDMQSAPTPSSAQSAPSPWDETPSAAAPAWAAPSAPKETPAASTAKSEAEEVPFEREPAEIETPVESPAWAPQPSTPMMGSVSLSSTPSSPGNGTDLTDEQIDRIARRVVAMLSDQVVRNIAWEVIPDLAEMVVKERIRQLESEA